MITKSSAAVVQLTAKGREQIAAARACHRAAVDRYFGDVLTDDQLIALTRISDQVVARLTQDRESPRH